MEVKINSYNDMMANVINWNKIGFGDIDRTDERIALQRSITLSEVDETISAIKANDKVEIIDGVGDVFVTGVFLSYLTTGYDMADIAVFDDQMLSEADGTTLINMIKSQTMNGHPNHYSIQYLIGWACAKYGGAEVISYMNAVLESNMTKFVHEENWREKSELVAATKKYSGQFDDIVAVRMEGDDGVYYVIRADNGKGKILKPRSFKEPLALLDPKVIRSLDIDKREVAKALHRR